MVGAGLERDEQRRPPSAITSRGERRDLGVRSAEAGVPALADDLLAAHDHRTDERVVPVDLAASPLRELQCPLEAHA